MRNPLLLVHPMRISSSRPLRCILTGFWRRNPAWRLEGDSSTLQDSNATCKADKADKRRGRGLLSAVSDECQRVAVCGLQSGTNGGCR